ncbi:hypothetical protein SAMN04487843_13914 [Methylobacterium sp. ap11]|uniref:hypothetical protein n=1 Tax=Methylobacterium sp. ap11 TaxID=1761799 RepID=UPI0008B08FB7|nr:hypothetical protein [Methylobacterium sp. ap11]SEP50682.1 hypothetical protein SAMN04487843_13914 [Methylobacterium sp. ap11]
MAAKIAVIPVAAALIPLLAAAAPAQDVGTGIPQGMPQQQFRTLDARSVGEVARSESGDASPALPFASNAELRAATVARHVRELRATNPIAAAEVAREMARHDYDAIFRSFLSDTALRPDDAGDVLTAFIVLQWMVANDTKAEPSPAALRAVRRQMVAPMADKPPLSQAATRAAFAEQVKLRTVLHHAGWQAAQRLGMVPSFVATLPTDFIPPAKLRAVALTDDGLVGKGGRRAPADRAAAGGALPEAPVVPGNAPPVAVNPPAEPRHAANWAAVEGVYFRSTTGVGVGGMVVIEFEPLILFRDGSYYEIDDAALEDVDLAAERAAKPRRFGRWTRSGDSYVLTGTGGKPQDYRLQNGSFFKAYPAEAGVRTIARSYRRMSGGGNTAMGGDVMIAVSNRYDFRSDGTYGRGGSTGATNSGATSGVSSAMSRRRPPEGGRYGLDRHTLTLTGPDGRSRRLFFAYGSQEDPPQPDREMAFIGGSVFTNPD